VKRVAVVGGGIAGLAAAYALAEHADTAGVAIEVIVLEAAGAVGGKLRVGSVAGIAVDLGAEAMLARRPEAVDLAHAVGLDLIEPTTTAADVRAGGASHPLPAATMMGIPSDVDALRASGVLSTAAVERVAAEPGDEPLPPLSEDVAVGALVRARLGNEVVDRLVGPLLGGVYAGRADELSLQATVPALAARLAAGGSLVAAARAVTDVGARDPSGGPVFVAVDGGVGRLPQALAECGRFTVRTGATVRAIRRSGAGFALTVGAVPVAEELVVDAVVVATPAAKSALLLRDVAPTAATELAAVHSASMAIVTLAFADVQLPPGSGLLVAAHEGLGTKAVTFSSQKWPMRTGGLTMLRASLGRAGETAVLQRDDAELIALVRHELVTLCGVTAEPVDALVTRWGGGLPQYAVGHVARVARVRAAVAAVPGLAVCGASYDGVGIPACIASAQLAAAQVFTALRASTVR
jgi:oxygen-dependent protoporphyrinogen oxidase